MTDVAFGVTSSNGFQLESQTRFGWSDACEGSGWTHATAHLVVQPLSRLFIPRGSKKETGYQRMWVLLGCMVHTLISCAVTVHPQRRSPPTTQTQMLKSVPRTVHACTTASTMHVLTT